MRRWIVGIDEVGRGPVAGPVHVCAIAMLIPQYKKTKWKGLTDSKKMTVRAREAWHQRAIQMQKEGYLKIGIALRHAHVVDARGINQCIQVCIKSGLTQLKIDPNTCTVLLDGGLKAPKEYCFQKTIIRGDSKHNIISLASVVAKVTRDALMRTLHNQYPKYHWNENKGYGTKVHFKAIRKNGKTTIHRKTFLSKVI